MCSCVSLSRRGELPALFHFVACGFSKGQSDAASDGPRDEAFAVVLPRLVKTVVRKLAGFSPAWASTLGGPLVRPPHPCGGPLAMSSRTSRFTRMFLSSCDRFFAPRRDRRSRRRFLVEVLEDRTVPTVYLNVTTTVDNQSGSLREAIIKANANQGPDDVFIGLEAGQTY